MARAIMISEHVYKELTELKKAGESYTKVIDRLIHLKNKKKLVEFSGAWSFLDRKTALEIEKTVKESRTKWRGVPKW
jgi:predicted CopG family antitoxin